MNFLAHAFLSFGNNEVLVGNLIADSVKGKPSILYPDDIRLGITLHRAIDHYTDNHPVYKESLNRIKPTYARFSGIITDIYYDHFLAYNWTKYSDEALEQFATHCYETLSLNYEILPERSKQILPYMKNQNWFVGYANMSGLQKVFDGMSRRIKHPTFMENALTELKEHYAELESDFHLFFPELITYAENKLISLGENS
ncbi:MAG: ACP phosphodiesterase [Bacteroidota bacterium]